MTAAEFSPEFRHLIDSRLDAVDQALLRVAVPYSERRNIVGEVETQIYELLSRRSQDPSREDVLAVLDSLDPPDSYIPEELRDRCAGAPAYSSRQSRGPRAAPRHLRAVAKLLASVACLGALIVANGLVVAIVATSDGVIPWIITAAAIAWLNYAGIQWLRSRERLSPGEIFREIRNNLAAWIATKNEETATE